MKVLFLIEGWIAPAPRYRVLQFLPYLAEQGVSVQVRALHGDSYPFFYHWPIVGKVYKAVVRMRRLFHLRDAHTYDVVFQQRLTLPFTSFIEKVLVKRNGNLIFDFDDALFQTEAGPDHKRMAVFRDVVQLSKTVIGGSDYLASHARDDAQVVPTVIETDTYLPKEKPASDTLVIGWMGTHSNFPNFDPMLAALKRVLARHPEVTFKVVSNLEPPFELDRLDFVRWSSQGEISELQSFDIGIMPLIDHSWNRGKCAFKLIQYMSVGIPVVAGDVGANAEVVLHGETGFLVRDEAGWEEALEKLIADGDLRKRMGQAGRERCVAHYSVNHCRERLLEILKQTAGEACS